jgi:hypothetical protein
MPLLSEDPRGSRLVIEVLYVEHCPNFPAALALVQRVVAELGVNAQVRTTMISDQAAAERTRFVGSPTVRVDGRDVDPEGELAGENSLECRLYWHEHALPATPRSARFARPCGGQPVQPDSPSNLTAAWTPRPVAVQPAAGVLDPSTGTDAYPAWREVHGRPLSLRALPGRC